MSRNYSGSSACHRNANAKYDDYELERELKAYNDYQNYSPVRDTFFREDSLRFISNLPDDYDPNDPEISLRLKWLDNSPRMSRLREHRHKRLVNKLEQFELWDMEQERKQKQYETAREQRYKNIMDRLKNQDFCVNLMKKRHESDLETLRELELYSNDHIYVDALDDPKIQYTGPITQYRKFQAEMDEKAKHLQQDIDVLNPRYRIEQAIIPRIERTRELYSVEPDIYTRKGKRLLKKPSVKAKESRQYKEYQFEAERPKNLKPIIHRSTNYDDPSLMLSRLRISNSSGPAERKVNFKEDIEYNNASRKYSNLDPL